MRGVSNLALVPEATKDHTLVMELDSWQLQGFKEEGMSPQVAVFTTFFSDHMNYYKGDVAAYLSDKAQIFLNQKPGDTLILGAQARAAVMDVYEGKIPSTTVVADADTMPVEWTLQIPGEHNRYNAGLALAAARAMGVVDEVSKEALEAFSALEGRLEYVRDINGVSIYNDNNSTTPEATIVALQALDTGNKNIVLIMGGADKGLDMSALIAELPRVKHLILLAGSGTQRILPELTGAVVANSMQEAFAEALRVAKEGDAVILSPAFASFGMFTNEYDRSDQFKALATSYAAD